MLDWDYELSASDDEYIDEQCAKAEAEMEAYNAWREQVQPHDAHYWAYMSHRVENGDIPW